MDFCDLVPPQFRHPWGGNFSFPPNSEGLGGETENHFPPIVGGEKGALRERRMKDEGIYSRLLGHKFRPGFVRFQKRRVKNEGGRTRE